MSVARRRRLWMTVLRCQPSQELVLTNKKSGNEASLDDSDCKERCGVNVALWYVQGISVCGVPL